MSIPKTITKVSKDGVTFKSNVDRAQYTITELKRAALRDVAKLIRKRMIEKLKKLPGMKRSKRVYKSTQYWNRKWESDLQIGFSHSTWYGEHQELGTSKQPKRGILRSTVFENINEIVNIQSKYLSGLSQENPSLNGTSEEDYKSPEGEEK